VTKSPHGCSKGKSSVSFNQKKKNETCIEPAAELEAIVGELEQGEISVDELSEKIKRASVLIKICKDKLTTTEEDVDKILEELHEKEQNEES